MMHLRKSSDRGYADHGWLQSYHSFSFAGYYDPRFMGWGNLCVINEDWIAPGMGFGTHGHRDMEIVSYVLEGALAHKDSMGNVESIPSGEVQRMSAGAGVTHSEFNHSEDKKTHLLQIWITPKFTGIKPSYEQKAIPESEKRGRLRLIVSPDGADGSLSFNADARMYAGIFENHQGLRTELDPTRKAYVHLIRGSITANGHVLAAGDALMMAGESAIELAGADSAELLVFDLAA